MSAVPVPSGLAALGPLMQLAYVPTDYDATLAYWMETMGVGPFFVWEHIPVDVLIHRGERTTADFSVALSYWGDMQIELIRQHNDAPSIYRDWNSDALHHIQIAVEDYDGALATCERLGIGMAMHGRGLVGVPDVRFAYLDLAKEGPAGFVEFAYRPPGGSEAMDRMARMKDAVRDWDGKDPIRSLF